VFTARYGLSPHIKQTRLVFKGLKVKSSFEIIMSSMPKSPKQCLPFRFTDHDPVYILPFPSLPPGFT
jgi:hypothetical protein